MGQQQAIDVSGSGVARVSPLSIAGSYSRRLDAGGIFFEEASFPFSYAYFHNLMAVFVRHP
jgi:hypothetical protein